MTQTQPKQSDLGVRVASAVVMVAVAGTALWLGGVWFDSFVALVAAITVVEFALLALKATDHAVWRVIGLGFGLAYIGYAAWLLIQIDEIGLLLLVIGMIAMIDIGAYFFGRSIGGPKIAPAISPSKTWAGLGGAVFGALLALCGYFMIGGAHSVPSMRMVFELLPFAMLFAVVAQAGDFFESWLKRRAGVKDSGALIPGHGGFFDRVDGLLPIAIILGSIVVFGYPHWLDR